MATKRPQLEKEATDFLGVIKEFKVRDEVMADLTRLLQDLIALQQQPARIEYHHTKEIKRDPIPWALISVVSGLTGAITLLVVLGIVIYR